MTIYRAIVGEHDFHRELLEGLAQTSGDTAERRALWQRFYCDVKAHAAAEEETLYAKLIATEDGQPDAAPVGGFGRGGFGRLSRDRGRFGRQLRNLLLGGILR